MGMAVTTDYDAPRRSTLQDVDTETLEARLYEHHRGCLWPRGAVDNGDADPGYALWWFVGVTTAPTKRDTQAGRGGPARHHGSSCTDVPAPADSVTPGNETSIQVRSLVLRRATTGTGAKQPAIVRRTQHGAPADDLGVAPPAASGGYADQPPF